MKDQYIYPPEGGWEDHTWYVVEVAMDGANPIWVALLYSGFGNGIDKAIIFNGGSDIIPAKKVFYLKALKRLISRPEMEGMKTNNFLPEEALEGEDRLEMENQQLRRTLAYVLEEIKDIRKDGRMSWSGLSEMEELITEKLSTKKLKKGEFYV